MNHFSFGATGPRSIATKSTAKYLISCFSSISEHSAWCCDVIDFIPRYKDTTIAAAELPIGRHRTRYTECAYWLRPFRAPLVAFAPLTQMLAIRNTRIHNTYCGKHSGHLRECVR